jgi:flagellar assembly protein FliH
MKSFRPHRFPPLSQVVEVGPRQAGDAGQWQASLDEGFRQGMDDGYRQGHQSGLTAGHAEGYAEGHKQGLRQGHEQARQDTLAAFDAVARPVETLLEKLEQLHADYQSAKRKEVVDLVARVARQVIRCELTLQPVQLLALVDETLAAMPPVAEGGVEVYLNAEDLRRIRELDPKRFRRWTLLADPRLESGECRVRAGDHEVDAGCNQRLAACMEKVSMHLMEATHSETHSEPRSEVVEMAP